MKTTLVSKTLLAVLALGVIIMLLPGVAAQEAALSEEAAAAQAQGLIAVGAGLAVGIAGLGTGLAQSSIGAAAVGAMAEDQKNFGKGLILTAIPETIVIFGLVIAILLIL